MADLAAQSIALALGVSALVTVSCRKVRFPALLPLIAVGLALGRSGAELIDASALGESLRGFVTVSIGLLIFEGTLHLNREELARAPRAVWGLLTIGALVTWTGSAIIAWWILDLSIPSAMLLGAALIVTGPTVVQPILRLVRVSPRLHAVLGAEAVLIDPIGVVATVTTLEVLRLSSQLGPELHLAGQGFWLFLKPLLGGAGVGGVMGLVGHWSLRRLSRLGKPDPQLLNLFAVGLCMTCVGIGEAITPEAGLVAVTICGVVVARARVLGATELRSFKELLAIMLVGTLFVLLASRFDVAQLRSIAWREIAFVAMLLVAVRPACVLLSTWRSKLSWPERLFASVFAPRGIVALSVIAVVAADLANAAVDPDIVALGASPVALAPDAARLEPIMFVAIVGTVLAATILSPPLAWALRVRAGRGNAMVLIGAHRLSIALARALLARGIHVRLIDSNAARRADASREGIDVVVGDATDTRWLDDAGAPHDAGWVLAWTGNDDVDQVAGRCGEERFGAGHAAMWSNKPARGPLRRLDIGEGRDLASVVDDVEQGRLRVVDVAAPQGLGRILAWIDDGIVTLAQPGTKPPDAGERRRFIGIGTSDGTTPPRGDGASAPPVGP
ncbi:MAG: cation:proton antiporter [Phycisphaerales bacterium]